MTEVFLPYGRQQIDDDDIAAVAQALRGDYLTTGPLVGAFEAALCRSLQAPHAVACFNGTAALHLAAMTLGLGPGQAVIVPSVTFVATANAVRMTGAEVVFADVDADSGLITPQTLCEALVRVPAGLRATAAFPVHLNGQSADMPGLAAVASENGLALVEDACHGLGTVDAAGNRLGACNHSDMAVFSFHPVKTVTTAEGGAVTTKSADYMWRMRRLCSHGITRAAEEFKNPDLALDRDGLGNPWYYEMSELGWNYRIPDVNCALGMAQLAKLDQFAAARDGLVQAYDALLGGISGLSTVKRLGGRPVWHLYVILIDFAKAGITRARLMNELRQQGIGTQVHYIPVHLQPYYRERYGETNLPGAMSYYERCLSLPFFAAMTIADCERVASRLRDLLS